MGSYSPHQKRKRVGEYENIGFVGFAHESLLEKRMEIWDDSPCGGCFGLCPLVWGLCGKYPAGHCRWCGAVSCAGKQRHYRRPEFEAGCAGCGVVCFWRKAGELFFQRGEHGTFGSIQRGNPPDSGSGNCQTGV